MPVGAIIGGVASLGGALLSSSSQKKAANQAAAAQQQSDQANIGLARDIYGQNSQNMRPFMQSGLRANRLLDGFLYGGPSTEFVGQNDNSALYGVAPSSGGNTAGSGAGSYTGLGGRAGLNTTNNLVSDVDRMAPRYAIDGAMDGPQFGNAGSYGMAPVESPFGGGSMVGGSMASPGVTAGGTAQTGQSPRSAWDTFRNSTNYQFRLGEGMDAVQQGYAGAGALQSGAAMRGINDYAQNFASNELNNYLGLLQGQQALGAGSASALAGVGNDYLGSVTASNRNSADAMSNAALLRGQANQNMFGGIAQGLGSLASSFKW